MKRVDILLLLLLLLLLIIFFFFFSSSSSSSSSSFSSSSHLLFLFLFILIFFFFLLLLLLLFHASVLLFHVDFVFFFPPKFCPDEFSVTTGQMALKFWGTEVKQGFKMLDSKAGPRTCLKPSKFCLGYFLTNHSEGCSDI